MGSLPHISPDVSASAFQVAFGVSLSVHYLVFELYYSYSEMQWIDQQLKFSYLCCCYCISSIRTATEYLGAQ